MGRSAFDCDVNSGTLTTTVGTSSGGGGSNQPSEADTEVELGSPTETDTSIPEGPSNPEDTLDETLSGGDLSGYTDNPEDGDTLSYSPGCADAFIEWFSVNKTTGVRTSVGSGVNANLSVTTAMLDQNSQVIGVGRCPDPSSPDGYGAPIESEAVDWLPECLSGADGCQQVDGFGVLQVYYQGNWIQAFPSGNTRFNQGARAVKIVETTVYYSSGLGKWVSYIRWEHASGSGGETDSTQYQFVNEQDARDIRWRIDTSDGNGTCINDCTIS